MPRENKTKRGRREEKKEEKKLKRKREKGDEEAPRHKKQKSQDPAEDSDVEITGLDNDYIPLVEDTGEGDFLAGASRGPVRVGSGFGALRPLTGGFAQ